MPTHNPWTVAEAVLKESRRVLLRGKPGTGKTYAARTLGLLPGQKVYQLTMTPETPMAEIRGHFVQKGGEFVWHDGPAVRAWREGARLIINEIDRSSEDVLSLLYAIMDDPEFAELTLPTGETITPQENFGVVATMNGVPDDLPDGLQDRLVVDVHITEMAEGALARLPEDLREPARSTSLTDNPERSISIRLWMEFAGLREKFREEENGLMLAAQAVFGENAPQALAAIEIADTADPAINMLGEEIPEKTLISIKEYLEHTQKNAGHTQLLTITEGNLLDTLVVDDPDVFVSLTSDDPRVVFKGQTFRLRDFN